MPKSKGQKILELEQKIKLLEKQKAFLEKQTENYDKEAIFFDMMIDMAIKQHKYKNKLIHHSDRGLQYCSNDYQIERSLIFY
jgi:hypothetical protein